MLTHYIYNACIKSFSCILDILKTRQSWTRCHFIKKKTKEFVLLRNDDNTISEASKIDRSLPIYWFHASSLGEYAVIRPLIQQIKHTRQCNVVVTFFSTTGYSYMRHNLRSVDFIYKVFLLPVDTEVNACRFVKALNPQAAIFAVADIWPNYIKQLSLTKTPAYLVSALIQDNSLYSKPYGRMHRQALQMFTKIFVTDDRSLKNLTTIGINNGIKAGNILFNNAVSTALSSYVNTIIERFCHEAGGVFIAGSISDKKDLDIMAHLANCNKDTKFIFVPHEISEGGLNNIKFNLEGYSILYSECTPETDFSKYQTLIIDFIGSLAKIYRYGKWAYVGGGFTKYLHSVVEPAAYGMSVAYGPCVKRQPTAKIMKEHGIGTVIRNKHELNNWFRSLKTNDGRYEELKHKIKDYIFDNQISINRIIDIIDKHDE